jgi:hypothetical protein
MESILAGRVEVLVLAGRVEVLKDATPLEFKVPVPNVVAPSKKVTVPLGAAPDCGVTVAVKVTF